jgi:HEAT repeat protein
LILRNLKARTYRDGVAAAAVSALAASRDPSAARVFLAMAKPPHRFGARAAAIRALADFAPAVPEAVPALCGLVGDRDERVSLVACAALGRTGDERALKPLDEAARSAGNPRTRVYASEAAARVRAGLKSKSRLSR